MRGIVTGLVLALAAPVSAFAQDAPASQPNPAASALAARIGELPAFFRGAGDFDATFAPGFRAAVPRATFDAISAQLTGALGPIVGVASVKPLADTAAEVVLAFRDGTATLRIAIGAQPPYQVEGLRVTGTAGKEANLDGVRATIQGLRGTTGFVVAQLGTPAPTVVQAHNADTPLAVGSAFKLVILAELVRATNAGERKWTDTVVLDGMPLPGGAYTLQPRGTAISLRELATKMISVSDNSATDLLLRHLGRAKVEAMLPVVGVADPARNRPFLGTLEMFKLKGVDKGSLGARYLALDAPGRRALLDSEVASMPNAAINPLLFRDGKPVRIAELEWFFTPNDLVRILDWLRRNTEANPEARAVLSVNPGLPPQAAAKWRWVGFKGGSEPGVMNMSLLLETPGGGWRAIVATWNDPAAEVDQLRLAGLVARAAELAAP